MSSCCIINKTKMHILNISKQYNLIVLFFCYLIVKPNARYVINVNFPKCFRIYENSVILTR